MSHVSFKQALISLPQKLQPLRKRRLFKKTADSRPGIILRKNLKFLCGKGSIPSERMRMPVLLAAALLMTGGCATTPLTPPVTEETSPISVYFIPLDDFNADYSVFLAQKFSAEFGVKMKSSLPIGSAKLQPFAGTQQYAAENIFALAKPVLERLPDQAPNAFYILLTNRDINSRLRTFRFMFSWHDKDLRTSVISTARLRPESDASPKAAELVAGRLNKMIGRAIGEMQFGWQRSTNIDDVMYAPIMSIDDLDRMGNTHRP